MDDFPWLAWFSGLLVRSSSVGAGISSMVVMVVGGRGW